MTAITDKKLRDKLMKKNFSTEKKRSNYSNKPPMIKRTREYNYGSSISGKRKTGNKRRTNTKNGEIWYEPGKHNNRE